MGEIWYGIKEHGGNMVRNQGAWGKYGPESRSMGKISYGIKEHGGNMVRNQGAWGKALGNVAI